MGGERRRVYGLRGSSFFFPPFIHVSTNKAAVTMGGLLEPVSSFGGCRSSDQSKRTWERISRSRSRSIRCSGCSVASCLPHSDLCVCVSLSLFMSACLPHSLPRSWRAVRLSLFFPAPRYLPPLPLGLFLPSPPPSLLVEDLQDQITLLQDEVIAMHAHVRFAKLALRCPQIAPATFSTYPCGSLTELSPPRPSALLSSSTRRESARSRV